MGRGLDHATVSFRFAALRRSCKRASNQKKRKEKNDNRQKTKRKKDAQKDPNDLQQFCTFSPKCFKTLNQIIEMMLGVSPGCSWRAEAEKASHNSTIR